MGKSGKPSRYLKGEGCHAASSNRQPGAVDSGGVSEDDTIGREAKVSWEISGRERATSQPPMQGGVASKVGRAAREVGVLRSSGEAGATKTPVERREGAWVNANANSEGSEDGWSEAQRLFDRITTPPKIQKLQRTLYGKAKAEPKYRFYSLYGELLRKDLSGYFDSIPHRQLLRVVARRISDGAILKLIRGWLRAPIVEPQSREDSGGGGTGINLRGTPQGGVISPLLANAYVNQLDWEVNERCELKPVMVRYADDFVILSRPGDGPGLLGRLKGWLERRGLVLNEKKTRLVDIRQEGIKFLGFALSWRQGRSGRVCPQVEPHPKSLNRDKLNRGTLWRSVDEVVAELNRKLKGWTGYFQYGNSSAVRAGVGEYVRNKLQRWLWRKHGCSSALWSSYTPEDLHERFGLFRMPCHAAWTPKR